MINGLSGDSPLGKIICIRAENDPERLKDFTVDEKRIRNEYRRKKALKMSSEKADDAIEQMRQAFVKMGRTNE